MNVQLQFACLAPGSIGVFTRMDTVEGVDPLTPVYVYNHEGQGWEPRFRGKTLCVSMFDLDIPPFMKATEYRVLNEDFLSKVTRGLKGGGIVTLVHRPEWEWHLGLAYSVFPLRPKNGTTTRKPKWWGAEDIWCEVGDVRQLQAKIDAEQERLLGQRAAPGFAHLRLL